MDGYYKTLWTQDFPHDEKANQLIKQGWRVVTAAIHALTDPEYGSQRLHFFTVLVYDKDDAEEAADERFNEN